MLYLGTNIRELRMKKGMTQEQLAYEFGVSSQTISRWENETTYPDITMLPVIADFFGVTIDELVGHAKECPGEMRNALFESLDKLTRREKREKLRELLSMYPNDPYLQLSLAGILNGIWKKEGDGAAKKELFEVSQRMLKSDKPAIQCGATMFLAFIAAADGEKKLAMKYAAELPSVMCGREIVAERILYNCSFKEAVSNLI